MKYTLNTIANIMNDNLPNTIRATVERVYDDIDAGTTWMTIVVTKIGGNKFDSYQALTPRLHNRIVNGDAININEIQALIDEAIKLLGHK